MSEEIKKIPVESYTRTVGYFAMLKNVNRGQQEQISNRKLVDPKTINYK